MNVIINIQYNFIQQVISIPFKQNSTIPIIILLPIPHVLCLIIMYMYITKIIYTN